MGVVGGGWVVCKGVVGSIFLSQTSMSELYLKELPLAVNTKVQMIVTTSCHHGIKIWAFKHCVAVARGGLFYVNPVINGKIRRGNKQNKKTAELFCRLNWNFREDC